MNRREKGGYYEEKAEIILKEAGYEILERNYYSPWGEIDIICEKDGIIVFVEVKYRKNIDYGYGSESINKKKLKRIYLTGKKYLSEKNFLAREVRFDMIIFLGEHSTWDKDILWGDEIWN
ncbi:MAG: YraN family protein [Fusobacteriaceae bacterium]